MTLNDDRSFLLRHLRNSFVVSDDTGVSEMVIEPDLLMESKIRASISSDPDLDLYSQSPDIVAEVEFGAARLRSSTVLRLQRLKEDNRSKAKVKSVRIVDSSAGIGKPAASTPPSEDIFCKKQVVHQTASANGKKTSLLSKLVSDVTVKANENPFNEYAKFDGKATFNVQTKSIDIFLPFLAVKAERGFPMPVVVVGTAKVRELVGLICWQYAGEQRLPALTAPDVGEFRLHLVEDDGEVDSDFPPLDGGEPISKFGFARLALVHRRPSSLQNRALPGSVAAQETTAEVAAVAVPKQRPAAVAGAPAAVSPTARPPSASSSHGQHRASSSSGGQVLVTVYDADQCSIKLRCESELVALRDIVSMVLVKRGIQSTDGWRLERLAQPGTGLTLDMNLAIAGTREFRLIRDARWPGTPVRQPSAGALVQNPTGGRPRSEASSATAETGNGGDRVDSGRPPQQQPRLQQQQPPSRVVSEQVASAAAATAEVASTTTTTTAASAAAAALKTPPAVPRRQSEPAAAATGGRGSSAGVSATAAAVSRRLPLDYRSYSVSMVQGQKLFFTKYDVLLGISAERIEIHPMSHKSALKLLFRQKAVTIDTSCLADCQLVDDKQLAAGKAQLRLTYLGGNDFRQYEFEADLATAREIVQVIRDIIEIRSDMQDMKGTQQTATTKSPTASRRTNNFV